MRWCCTPTPVGPFSLHETPPKECTDMAQGKIWQHKATQTPTPECQALNTMINAILYHTPTKAGTFTLHKSPLHKKQMYAATHHPAQEPSTQTPTISMSMVNIWYHTPTVVPSPCAKTPPHKKWMCAATHHPTQEPPSTQTPATYMLTVNIWYHTPTVADTFALCKNPPAQKMDV
ncbi:hypothetical protein BS47DRAFT_1369156 [Hydnum rufescens UP504]|uniref:Uncharacterized protein n=1 Tax=Hydnum rufescens UP504 TaxID=1448309 RepID=A0A9P6AFH0_9AGAM|nr:hypothetical protein BS47DRAFT_1369156 [Hydnum rufescens UP504]